MANTPPRAYSENYELNILYDFKKYVQEYREGNLFGNLKEILKTYPKVVDIAAANPKINKTRQQIFDSLMYPLKNALGKIAVKRSELENITIPSELLPLFGKEKLARFNDAVARLNENIQAERNLDAPAKKKSKAKAAPQEKEDLFFRLKQEAIAYLNSPKCSYTPAEKKKYMKIVETAESMEVEHNIGTVKIYIEGLPKEIPFKIKYEGKTFVSNPDLSTPSTYGILNKKDVAALSKIGKNKRKTLEASAVVAARKSKERADKRAQDEKDNKARELQRLQKERPALKKALDAAFDAMLLSMDSEKLFEILAKQNSAGKKLSAWLRPREDSVSLQDALYNQTVKACVYNPVVWALYQKKDGKDSYNVKSYYEDLQKKIRHYDISSEDLAQLFEAKDSTEKRNEIIKNLRGLDIPLEIAQEIFLQKVFEYGMSIYSPVFSPERFDKMNQIMEPFGYRISMRPFVAEQNGSETKPVSEAVLDEMKRKQKIFRNKELALLYHIGEAISGDNPYNFDRYHRGNNKEYERFAALYYGVSDEIKAKSNQVCLEYWEKFIGNATNLRIAKQVYGTLHALTNDKTAESKMIKAMANGSTGLENLPLASESMHHNMERKYAGLFETVQGIEAQGSIFNADEFLASTFSAHPADPDPHRLAHLFDIEAMYIYMHEGRYKKGPISGIKKGDVVFAPMVEVKRNGQFEPAIPRGTFLITSHSGAVSAPEVCGKDRKSSRFMVRVVNMVRDAKKAVEKLIGANKQATLKTANR